VTQLSVLDRVRRWLLAGGLSVGVALGVLFALRNLPANGASETQTSPHAAAASSGKAALGYADANKSGNNLTQGEQAYETTGVEVVKHHTVLRLTGSLAADEQSDVASNATGMVAEVRVDRGSVVKKGDVLVQLDPTDAQNHLDEGLALVEELKAKLSISDTHVPFLVAEQPDVQLAKVSMDLAESRRKRANVLLPQKAISLDECEQIRAEHGCAVQRYQQALQQVNQTYQSYKTAVVRLAALHKAVADTTIKAPFDGVVVEKHVGLGEQVVANFIVSKIITMVRINPLRVSLTVPQQSIGQVRAGQKVRFAVDSFPEKTFTAEVRYITPVVTGDTRSLVVEAMTPNPDGRLRPGLFVTAELELPEQRSDVFVPLAAVQRMGDSARVFVVHEGTVREQVVALGQAGDHRVLVTAGLDGTERLVADAEQAGEGSLVRR
jgi:RND family efflux transporter MFP subunit